VRYYFHLKDGETTLDDEGMELSNLDGVKNEALQTSHNLLKGVYGEKFWTCEPWLLWVTDQPNGGGNTVLSLTFSSSLSG